eukprot:625842-Rhodomonas_salina.1
MELLHVTAMHTGPSEPIIALRNAAFLNQQTFVEVRLSGGNTALAAENAFFPPCVWLVVVSVW